MMNGEQDTQANKDEGIVVPAAPSASPGRIGRIITALKNTIQKYRQDNHGQVYMSSNFKFDN